MLSEVIQSSERIYPQCSFSHWSCTLLRTWISKFHIHSLYRELITLARRQTVEKWYWRTQKINWGSHKLHKSHFNEILTWKLWRELSFSDSSPPPKRILSKKGAAEWRLLSRKPNLQDKGLYCSLLMGGFGYLHCSFAFLIEISTQNWNLDLIIGIKLKIGTFTVSIHVALFVIRSRGTAAIGINDC